MTPAAHRSRGLTFTFWGLALVLAALKAWTSRHAMNPDGMSYLDLSDAWLAGRPGDLGNGYWSPVYPLLLAVGRWISAASPATETTVVHLTNLVILVGSLAAFQFLLTQVLALHRREVDSAGVFRRRVPEPIVVAVGYLLFIWGVLHWIGLKLVTPDLCVATCLFLAAGLGTRIIARGPSVVRFALLGLVLGVGYLAKTVMMPLAAVFFVMLLPGIRPSRRWVPWALGLLVFLAVAAPFVVGLSQEKQRFTYGDSGRINYAWLINGVPRYIHWHPSDDTFGTPEHTTRRLDATPPVYEFEAPISGTYPPWLDPSYWFEGIQPRFDLDGHLERIDYTTGIYAAMFEEAPWLLALLGAIALVVCMGAVSASGLWRSRVLIVPPLAGMVLYLVIHLQPRYVGGHVVLLVLGLFSALRMPRARAARGLLFGAVTIVAVLWVFGMVDTVVPPELEALETAADHPALDAARALEALGVPRGARVAVIKRSMWSYWARVGGFRIIAEVQPRDSDVYESLEPSGERRVMETFRALGVRWVVTVESVTRASALAWEPLGDSGWYVHRL